MEPRIEAAGAEDTDAIAELWVALARGQREHGSHLLAEANREHIRDAVARHLVTDGLRVARVDGEGEQGVVGFVMFDLEAGSYEQDVTRGVVRNLYVRPAYRDGGVGAALLASAEAALASADADVVALEAMSDNDAARRFYLDQGYSPHRVEFEKPLDGPADGSDTHSREDA